MAHSLDPARKPTDGEIDAWGLTHPGLVRARNEDHFLLCQLRKQIEVYLSSLPSGELQSSTPERLAVLAMVADGVGGRAGGEEASRRAIATITRYVVESIETYYASDTRDHEAFRGALHGAALRAHADVLEAGERDPRIAGMATTLTLWIGVWPSIFVVQVGDSRHYVLRDGRLEQETRDQTIGQMLVDEGVLTPEHAGRLPVAPLLASSIGGSESSPVVKRLDSGWGHVHLVCSDGLTRHVSDERIRERLSTMTSARQACEDLLQDALDGGGTDNITVVVGRALPRDRGE